MADGSSTSEGMQPTQAEHQSWLGKLFHRKPKAVSPISPVAPTMETPMAGQASSMTPEAPAAVTPPTPTPVKA